MMIRSWVLSCSIIILLYNQAFGQILTGTVTQQNGQVPLAFATVSIKSTTIGTTTDLNGNFQLDIPVNASGFLTISHIGFNPYSIPLKQIEGHLGVALKESLQQLDEVVFHAGENPANEVVRRAVSQKKVNDPNNLSSYEYNSYNKFWITATPVIDVDSIVTRVSSSDTVEFTRKDSSYFSMDSLLKRQHLFLSESATKKKYLKPGRVNEEVLANQISGLKTPLFVSLATDFQPFTFYEDIISLLEKDYINPISRGSLNKYEFHLEDTTYYQGDSVFVMSFEPKTNSFNGLKGSIAITQGDYAIYYIDAVSADRTEKNTLSILQQYQKVDQAWFPSQLNTDLVLDQLDLDGAKMKIVQRSFITNVKINPPLSQKQFSDITLNLGDGESYGNISDFRPFELNSIERNSYSVLDSIAAETKLFRFERMLTAVALKRISLGYFDLALDHVIGFNQFEGIRPEIGILSSPKLSKYISFGGYGAFGFKDEQFKYGGHLHFFLDENQDRSLQFSYKNDLSETGQVSLFEKSKTIDAETVRHFGSDRYDFVEAYAFVGGGRIAQGLDMFVGFSNEKITPQYAYVYSSETFNATTFDITEVHATLSKVTGQKFINLLGYKLPAGYELPVASLRVTKALDRLGDFNFMKYDLLVKHEMKYPRLGIISTSLFAGLVDNDAPLAKIYDMRGAADIDVYTEDYFQTMGYYEFSGDKFASLFFTYQPYWTPINYKFSKPEFLFHQNMGYSSISNIENHQLVSIKSASKGYYESGLSVNNLFRFNYADIAYVGLGVGSFYRYGSYAFPDQIDNFTWRVNVSFGF